MEVKDQNNLILVYYISIVNLPVEQQYEYLKRVHEKIYIDRDTIPNFGAAITIPTYGESRIECINPVYITDTDLIKKHERLMAELHESMTTFINNMNDNKKDNE